tara:strand:+ start:7486 stop:8454 length:969 start_codon:yes stop_codon:yes gene_type:complete
MSYSLLDYAALVPSARASGVIQTFAESSPVLERLQMIDVGAAESYKYNVETGLGGATWRAIGQNITADNGVISPAQENLSILSRVVQIDRQRSKNADYKAAQIRMGSKACALTFTKDFFDGDQAVTPEQMHGLNARIGTGGALFRAIDESDATTNGGYMNLSIDVLEQAIDYVYGPNSEKMLLMSKLDRRLLSAALIQLGSDKIVLVQTNEGSRASRLVSHYDDVEIGIIEDDASGAEILGKDETRGSDDFTSSLYCVRFGRTEGEGVMGLHNAEGGTFEVEDRAGNATQNETVIEGKVGMANFHARSFARMSGIKNANYTA